MASIASQMKDLKRRGIQKVLQGMGIADKTNDEAHSQVYQNFATLGNFLTHFKQSVQSANTSVEKMTKAQSNVASDLQAYIHSELSDDTVPPTGELTDILFNSQDEATSMHAVMLQEVAERFYYACNDISNTVLNNMLTTMDELVIKPITRDEELNAVTKELTNERQKLNLDYDAYRRSASNVGNAPGEQERYEAKVRAAKDRFDVSSKKVSEHLTLRNYNRGKIIVHSVLSLVQQYNQFFSAASALLQEATGVLNPLLEYYQMDERQFLEMMRADSRPPRQPIKDGANVVPPATKRSPSPPHQRPSAPAPKQAPTPAPKPVPTAKPVPPVRSASPPRSPTMTHREPTANGNNTAPPSAPRVERASPLLDDPDLMGDFQSTTSKPAAAPKPPSPAAPVTPESLFDNWQTMGGETNTHTPPATSKKNNHNDANFVDASFTDIPTSSTPPPTQPSSSSNLFEDPLFHFDFNSSATPLRPQAAPQAKASTPPPQQHTYKPTPPPQQQPSFGGPNNFNMSGAGFGAQQGFGGPNNFNMPGGKPPGYNNMGGGFNVPPQGPAGGYPAGGFGAAPPPFGGAPNFGPGAGYGKPPPGGPYNGSFPNGGNYFAKPPNAGVSFVQDNEGLDANTASKLRAWADKAGPKKNNLRALIGTMHEVLWTDSGWEMRGLGELISPPQVVKAYRRASLIVHPDKIASCTEEQKIIAKRVYECLQESYEVFKNEQH